MVWRRWSYYRSDDGTTMTMGDDGTWRWWRWWSRQRQDDGHIIVTKRPTMLNLVIFIEADCCVIQKTLLSWKDFKNYVNEKIFLVTNYYKIVVQKALLSWQDLTFSWHIITRLLFKKHCFLDKIYIIYIQKALSFLNYVNEIFLVAYHYNIVVQTALLSWQDSTFFWHIITRSLFKKHCFLVKIYRI